MHPKKKAALKKHRLRRKNRRLNGFLNFKQAADRMEMTYAQFKAIAEQVPHEHYGIKIWRFRPADLDAFRAAHRHIPESINAAPPSRDRHQPLAEVQP